jgi:hypothetical protein
MPNQLQTWLKEHNLEDLYEPLNNNGITFDMLNSISTDTLNEIGLKVGQRKRLFAATGHESKRAGSASKVHPEMTPSPSHGAISINFSPVMNNNNSNTNTNTLGGSSADLAGKKTTKKCFLCRGLGALNELMDAKQPDQPQKEPMKVEFYINGKQLTDAWKTLPVEWRFIVQLRADLFKIYGMGDRCHICDGTGKVKIKFEECLDCQASGIGLQKFYLKRPAPRGGCCSDPEEPLDDMEIFVRWWNATAGHPDKALLHKIPPFPKVWFRLIFISIYSFGIF